MQIHVLLHEMETMWGALLVSGWGKNQMRRGRCDHGLETTRWVQLSTRNQVLESGDDSAFQSINYVLLSPEHSEWITADGLIKYV